MMNNLSEKITKETIQRLKREKNAVILAHNYQILPVQDVADFTGDSLALAQEATRVDADIIVFAGVRFMAETAKLLNPDAKVLLTHIEAGCPMADMITGEKLREFKAQHPGSITLCYVNSTVDVKAESDICCTSSNAVKIVNSIPKDKTILFVPDQNLGTYAADQTGRKIIVWDGYCNVHHQMIRIEDVDKARVKYPDHTIIVHPECKPEVFRAADVVASTQGMEDYAANHDNLIIGTEVGLVKKLQAMYPLKSIEALCERSTCINMKKTSLKEVLLTLLEETGEVTIEEGIAARALKSIRTMLDLSN